MTLSEKIQELSEIWGKIVGCDHHKDCDVNHWISACYTYGNVEYRAEHGAYIGESFDKSFRTKRAAEEFLCRELIRQIEEQIKSNLEIYDEKELYWSSLQKTFEIVRNFECSDSGDQTNYKELFLELKGKYESQEYHCREIEKTLDFNNVPKYDAGYPEMKFSLNYRVDLLVEKLKSQKQ